MYSFVACPALCLCTFCDGSLRIIASHAASEPHSSRAALLCVIAAVVARAPPRVVADLAPAASSDAARAAACCARMKTWRFQWAAMSRGSRTTWTKWRHGKISRRAGSCHSVCGIFQPHRHGRRCAVAIAASARRVRDGRAVSAIVSLSPRRTDADADGRGAR